MYEFKIDLKKDSATSEISELLTYIKLVGEKLLKENF